MREEKNVLNSDVEIPEVVLKKTDDALAQIRESTKPVRKAKKESRFQGGFRYAQAAAIACAVLVGAGGLPLQQQLFTIYGVGACRAIYRQRKNSRKTWQNREW